MEKFHSIVNVNINPPQTPAALRGEGLAGLEGDLDEFLGDAGCRTGGGVSEGSVHLAIDGAGDWQIRVARLLEFLQTRGVPSVTTLTVLPPWWEPWMPSPREVPVFPNAQDAEPGAAPDRRGM